MRARRDAKLGGSDQAGRTINTPEASFLEKNTALNDIEAVEGIDALSVHRTVSEFTTAGWN